MVEITTFNRIEKIVVIETESGKVKLSFDEWEQIEKAHDNLVVQKK